ncbi:hypothetical protein MKW94_010044 [Papaver nudicaule]|uniref:RING-type domain-containing protein n=1 Tax=Papaver nudicaule TaxID=74823 RepID=A0AA41RMV0_PAPNU|nr:hypothetical protein [Papaver nudicaule]
MEVDYARNIEEYCDCLHCLWRRGYFDHKFVQETIQTVSPTSYSSLFDVVDIKEFSGGGGEEHKDECSICWKEFKNGISISELPCFHVFHTKCIVNWFARVNNCPLCRSRVDPLESGS